MRINDKEQINTLHRQGLALLQSHRLDEAKLLFARICDISPEDADAWYKLGTVYGMLGNIDEAGDCCRRAVELQPNHGEAHANLGNILFHKGRREEAIAHYRTALRINPGNVAAHNNLGNALKIVGRQDEAIESYKHAIAAKPNYAIGHNNLGVALKEAGRLQEANDSFRHALTLNPNYAEAYNNLGLVLKDQDRMEEAVDAIKRAMAIKPGYAEAHYNLANTYLALGRLEAAVGQFRQAIRISPNFVEAYNNLGNALREQGHIDLAIEHFNKAITLNPEDAGAYNNLGIIFRDEGRMNDAEEMIQRSLQIRPDLAVAYNTLGTIRNWRGKPDEAAAMFQKALDLGLDHTTAAAVHSNLLMTMSYLPGYSAEALLTAAQDWNLRHASNILSLPPPTNPRDPERRLRIGYVSADFHIHPVGIFSEAVLSRHDKSLFEVFCYYNGDKCDDVTVRLQKAADHWQIIKRLSDQAVADRIRRDEIDILIDLSGHTGENRLLVFSRRPAPLQVSWMAYFATTGLTAMDYIIADRFVIPPQEERYYSERVEYMPRSYLCFTAPDANIPVTPLPALSRGSITFGCFNNPAKLNAEVIGCWSRLLRELPDARLILKYKPFDDDKVKNDFLAAFAECGIGAERIGFSGHSLRDEYLASYNEIDIGLDPFPFNGCTTTVEALWMGVPVMTLRGDRFAGYMGESILKNLGLDQYVADSQDDYIERTIALATDLPRLTELRANLRHHLVNSPLYDGIGFTRTLETIYRKIWTRWCSVA